MPEGGEELGRHVLGGLRGEVTRMIGEEDEMRRGSALQMSCCGARTSTFFSRGELSSTQYREKLEHFTTPL